MQFLAPAENGMYANGLRFSMRSGRNRSGSNESASAPHSSTAKWHNNVYLKLGFQIFAVIQKRNCIFTKLGELSICGYISVYHDWRNCGSAAFGYGDVTCMSEKHFEREILILFILLFIKLFIFKNQNK